MKNTVKILSILVFTLILGFVAYVNINETMNIFSHLIFTMIFSVIFIIGFGVMLHGDRPSNPNKFSKSIE